MDELTRSKILAGRLDEARSAVATGLAGSHWTYSDSDHIPPCGQAQLLADVEAAALLAEWVGRSGADPDNDLTVALEAARRIGAAAAAVRALVRVAWAFRECGRNPSPVVAEAGLLVKRLAPWDAEPLAELAAFDGDSLLLSRALEATRAAAVYELDEDAGDEPTSRRVARVARAWASAGHDPTALVDEALDVMGDHDERTIVDLAGALRAAGRTEQALRLARTAAPTVTRLLLEAEILADGDVNGAIETARAALDTDEDASRTELEDRVLMSIAQIEAANGLHVAALETARGIDKANHRRDALARIAAVMAQTGRDPAGVLREAESCEECWTAHSHAMFAFAEALLLRGEVDRAATLVGDCEPWARFRLLVDCAAAAPPGYKRADFIDGAFAALREMLGDRAPSDPTGDTRCRDLEDAIPHLVRQGFANEACSLLDWYPAGEPGDDAEYDHQTHGIHHLSLWAFELAAAGADLARLHVEVRDAGLGAAELEIETAIHLDDVSVTRFLETIDDRARVDNPYGGHAAEVADWARMRLAHACVLSGLHDAARAVASRVEEGWSRSSLFADLALAEANAGLDPTPSVQAALTGVDDVEVGTEVFVTIASAFAISGTDPSPLLERAARVGETVKDHCSVARAVALGGGDPTPSFDAARSAIDRDGPVWSTRDLFEIAAAEATTGRTVDATITEAVATARTILDDAGRAETLADGARALAAAGCPVDDLLADVAQHITAFKLRRTTALAR